MRKEKVFINPLISVSLNIYLQFQHYYLRRRSSSSAPRATHGVALHFCKINSKEGMNSSRIEIVHAELERERERERERKNSLNSRFILLSPYLAFHVFLGVFIPIPKETVT